MITQDYLERDDDLLGRLTAPQRAKAERVLTSFAIEDMRPERFHTEAVVDLVRGAITSDEFAQRVAAARTAGQPVTRS